jgi:hypothetical protein
MVFGSGNGLAEPDLEDGGSEMDMLGAETDILGASGKLKVGTEASEHVIVGIDGTLFTWIEGCSGS